MSRNTLKRPVCSRALLALVSVCCLSASLLAGCQGDARQAGSLNFMTRFPAPAFSVQAIPANSSGIVVAVYTDATAQSPEHQFLLTPAEPSRQLGLLEPGPRRVVALAFDARHQLLAGGSAQATVVAGQTSQVSLELSSEFRPDSRELAQLSALMPPVSAPAAGSTQSGSASLPTGSTTNVSTPTPVTSATVTPAQNSGNASSATLNQPVTGTINTIDTAAQAVASALPVLTPVAGAVTGTVNVVASAVPNLVNNTVNALIPSAVPSLVASIVPSAIPSVIPSVVASIIPSPLASLIPVIPGVTATASPTPAPTATPRPICVLGICL